MVERNRRNIQAYDLKVTVPGADIFFGIKYPGIAGVSPAVGINEPMLQQYQSMIWRQASSALPTK